MSQSASIWRMKTMRRLPALLGMLAIVLSCSKLDFMSGWTEFEYDTELAEAYFCGDNPDEGSYQYRLMLLSGRTDGDFNLTYGAKAVLVLNSPEMNSGCAPSVGRAPDVARGPSALSVRKREIGKAVNPAAEGNRKV